MNNPDITLAVKRLLLDNADISRRVNRNIFVNRMHQGAPPKSILLWVVTEIPFLGLDGAIGMDQATIQFDCYAKRQDEAREIAWYVWNVLDGYQGVSEQVHILGATRASGIRDGSDRVRMGTDQYRFNANQDMRFTYRSCQKVQT